MKVLQNNILGLTAAVVVAQLIDFAWYSGMLAWQPATEQDFILTIIKDVILAVASFVIYDMFYDGDYWGDVFEFSLMFTVMHFALDDKPMVTSAPELIATVIVLVHSFLILFSVIFVVHFVKSLVGSPKKKR